MSARRIAGWLLTVPGALWILGAFLFGLALALATDGDSPSTAGEKLFIILLFGGVTAIPGIAALGVGLMLLIGLRKTVGPPPQQLRDRP